MSQNSTTSLEPILSQETFNDIFSTVQSILKPEDLSRIQTEYNEAPRVVQLTESNIHENVMFNLEAVSVVRPELEFPFPPDQPFTRTALKQEPIESPPEQDTKPFFPPMVTTPPPDLPNTQPLIVCNTDFPGYYGFGIGFEEEKSPPTKSAQWTYSPYLEKLFMKMRCIVPMRIKMQEFPTTRGLFVRVVVIYKQPEHYREIVERCPNHITKQKDGHHAPKHLLRCENPQTLYETCPETGRHSLKIPLGVAQAGSDFVTEMFQMMCFSSCPGGLNRRPILVIFTLEYGNRVVGRKAQNVRICACPGRDRGIEENAEAKRRERDPTFNSSEAQVQPIRTSTPNMTPPPTPQVISAPHSPPAEGPSTSAGSREEANKAPVPKLSKKRSYSSLSSGFEVRAVTVDKNPLKKLKTQDEEIFTIQVKGREKYEMLLKIKEGLDLMDLVPQAQIDKYRASCPPCGRVVRNLQNSDSQNSTDSQQDEMDNTPPMLSQLSRSDSGSSTQSPPSSQQSSGGAAGINAVRFTLRRTVSLEKKSAHHHHDLLLAS